MSRFLHSTSAEKYFDSCPAQFYLWQNGAPRGTEPQNYLFGRAAHVVMELYVDHCVNHERRSDITVIGQFIDQAVRSTALSLRYYDELALVVRGFLNVYEIDVEHSISREGGIAFDDELKVVEWPDAIDYDVMRTPVEAKGNVFWRCKLDHALLYLEDHTLVVQDYKSDIFAPSKSAIAEPSSRFYQQARKYAWAAWRGIYPAEIIRVDFVFMRYVAYGNPLVRSLTFTKDECLETQELQLAKSRYIEATQDFIATPGDHCANCSFRETACPIINERADADPASLMRRFLLDRVLQDERRARLKEHVAEYGYTGGLGPLRPTFEQGESEVPDMKRVWEELLDVGVENPWAVMKLSATDAKRILDKDIFERLLQRAYDKDIEVRFNVHQPKEVLLALAEARGIPTKKPGKTGMKDRTVAELAWDLANCPDEPSAGDVADLFDGRPPLRDSPIEIDLATIQELS
jgi:hypothetical protein